VSSEICQVESMITDKLRDNMDDREHAMSAAQLTGNLSCYDEFEWQQIEDGTLHLGLQVSIIL